jgi:hypothetical protein
MFPEGLDIHEKFADKKESFLIVIHVKNLIELGVVLVMLSVVQHAGEYAKQLVMPSLFVVRDQTKIKNSS